MATYLDTILASHRERYVGAGASLADLIERAELSAPTRDFRGALVGGGARRGISVIAEIKRRSPSKGDLALDLDVGALARAYERGGASCLSVLTDTTYFGGSPDDLVLARERCALPVLRKDFTVSPVDIYEARVMGADAILLIVAALDDDELSAFHEIASSLGLGVLVEVHDEDELERALDVGATIIGVNQRDLRTFEVDRDRARRVGALIPDGVIRIAESGISEARDVTLLAEAGYDAVLIGEALVTSNDPAGALARFIDGGVHHPESGHPGASVV